MHKKLFKILFLCGILALSLAITFADGFDDQGNPNDPNENESANACFEEGSMDGKCVTNWEWECGWYLIRFEYGLLSREDFPAGCASLLPPLPLSAAPIDNCLARNDRYDFNPRGQIGSASAPGVLANDACSQVVSNTGVVLLQGVSVSSLVVNSDGSFSYRSSDPDTIFTFTYTTENGSIATVTIYHDIGYVIP